MTHLQTDVPEESDERGHGCFRLRVPGVRQQDHEVDVRVRMKLAPSVAAHGQQGRLIGVIGRVVPPGGPDDLIDQRCPLPHERFDGLVGLEGGG